MPDAMTRLERDRAGRIVGSLLGGALGDALGYVVEFSSLHQIRQRYGQGGIRDLSGAGTGDLALISDDTQMTLFTAEALIRCAERLRGAGGRESLVASYHRAYVRWLHTQEAPSPAGRPAGLDGWLIQQPVLYAARAPGLTCLSALRSGRFGTVAARINGSKGCGTVMRSAPFGLVLEGTEAWRHAIDAAAVTHGHPSGFLAAGAMAVIIQSLMEDGASPMDRLQEGVERALSLLDQEAEGGETARALREAVERAAETTPGRATPEDIEGLGTGNVAEECLAIAVYAAMVAPDAREALVLAVNHSGDSDSTGAVAGNLVGAMYGVEGLPAAWIARVEGRALVEQVAYDLAAAFGEPPAVDGTRYPPEASGGPV